MSKIKNLSKITTRYTNKEGVANPITQKYDFKKPTMVSLDRKVGIAQPTRQKTDFSKPTLVNLSRKELEILYTTGRIEADGITIIYED